MKKFSLFLILTLLFLVKGFAGECFDELPGEENIPDNTPEKIKLTKLTLGKNGQYGYIATEYLGSANLQASIYLVKNKQYCLAGDLGSFTGFRVDKSMNTNGHYGVIVFSKSGLSQFFRTYKYSSGDYVLTKCEVTLSGARKRTCKKNEL